MSSLGRYFGKPWDAAVIDMVRQVTTPVGATCIYCDTSIGEDDQGFIIPAIHDGRHVEESPVHRECLVRAVLGPLEHLQGQCSCRGYEDLNDHASRPVANWRDEGKALLRYLEARKIDLEI